MATLATFFDRLTGRGGAQAVTQGVRPDARRASGYRLRPFPNDDVHLHVKRIDNSRVIRAVDPQTPRVCWKLIGGVSTAAVLLIGMLLPSGYRLMAGYQLEELRKEQDLLSRQISELETSEAKLLSPERLAELAKLQDFADPDPSRIIHLDTKASGPAVQAMARPVEKAPAPASAPAEKAAPAAGSSATEQ
ncbi:MAG: hypothetical protein JNL62_13370 [Bryobacterales bacterium]|nr:hypothetical protein [Bryobacterales bacterium]